MSTLRNIIIVGAGPAGLTLALLLAKTGINVQVLEQASAPTNETRAVFYQPVSLFEFERAGILDDVLQSALHPRSVSVRDIQGSKLFGLPRGNQVALMVNELAAIIQEHIDRQPTASILWGHRVVDVGEADGKAWVEVQNSEELLRFEADYVVGCDGGQSTVRRLVFGEKAMPGFTWDKNIVAADVSHHQRSNVTNAYRDERWFTTSLSFRTLMIRICLLTLKRPSFSSDLRAKNGSGELSIKKRPVLVMTKA